MSSGSRSTERSAATQRPGRGRVPRAERVLVCDDLAPEAYEVFRQHGFEPEPRTGLSEDELVKVVPGATALVVRSATRITRRVIEAAPHLRVIGRAGVGVDNIDLEAATDQGVVVMNAPTANTTTTAELAIALLCALARNIPQADRSVHAGSWKKKQLMGTELTGKTLGVVGLGRIGRVVATRARGLDMNVVAYDPYLSGERSPVDGVELVELDDLLSRVRLRHAPRAAQRHHPPPPLAQAHRAHEAGRAPDQRRPRRPWSTRRRCWRRPSRVGPPARAPRSTSSSKEPPPPDHPLLARDRT